MGRSIKEILNEGDANKLGAVAQAGRLGTALAINTRFVRGSVGDVTAHVLELPETARAAAITRAHAIAGSFTGILTPVPSNSPASGQVGLTPDGKPVFNATNAVTEAEVQYIPHEGRVFEEVVSVTSGSGLGVPLSDRKVAVLLEAEATEAGAVGAKDTGTTARGSTASAGDATITHDGDASFSPTDAVTRGRIKYVAQPGVGTEPGPVGADAEVEDKDF
jgi:hypothetical protein